MEIFKNPEERLVKRLLADAELPTADLTPGHLEHFFGCGGKDDMDGVIGLELYGPVALLRSLAVVSSRRRQGVGRTLVERVEDYARRCGVEVLYLLTTTAEPFFSSIGYKRVARESAPEAIKATREYAAICPASSALMVKTLSTNPK
jgi:amino-acid N-acetyltransferase